MASFLDQFPRSPVVLLLLNVPHLSPTFSQNTTFSVQNPTFSEQNPTFSVQNRTFSVQNPTFSVQNRTFLEQNPEISIENQQFYRRRSDIGSADRRLLRAETVGNPSENSRKRGTDNQHKTEM